MKLPDDLKEEKVIETTEIEDSNGRMHQLSRIVGANEEGPYDETVEERTEKVIKKGKESILEEKYRPVMTEEKARFVSSSQLTKAIWKGSIIWAIVMIFTPQLLDAAIGWKLGGFFIGIFTPLLAGGIWGIEFSSDFSQASPSEIKLLKKGYAWRDDQERPAGLDDWIDLLIEKQRIVLKRDIRYVNKIVREFETQRELEKAYKELKQ